MSETQMDSHWNLSEMYGKIKRTFAECSESHGISITALWKNKQIRQLLINERIRESQEIREYCKHQS